MPKVTPRSDKTKKETNRTGSSMLYPPDYQCFEVFAQQESYP